MDISTSENYFILMGMVIFNSKKNMCIRIQVYQDLLTYLIFDFICNLIRSGGKKLSHLEKSQDF